MTPITSTENASGSTTSNETEQIYARDFATEVDLRGLARCVVIGRAGDGKQRVLDWVIALRRNGSGGLEVTGSELRGDYGDVEDLASLGVSIAASGTELRVTVSGVEDLPLSWSTLIEYALMYP